MSDENIKVTDTAVEQTETQEPITTTTTEPEKTFTQDDVNRLIAQRLAAEERKHQKQVQAAREEGRTEAEKLAKMSEEQRVQHEREQAEKQAQAREAELAKREAELTRRELKATAGATLESKGIPRDLAEILDYTDADACNASIAVLEKAFNESVQAKVNERLKASGMSLPASAGKPDFARMSDAEYYAMLNNKH